ncbi:restriction endonuclease subunit S [Bacteroides thetaiotaomicron]|nr:restriction endonuclease subunit S [Bacteroides thetaiotaomicron]RGQ39510.1 restriction endonuclease subunit S [Bacteroides thetaiotaomicron]
MDTKKLRQKILDLAIRGKLVPQDPNDEPASVLLERIKAEKERLIKEGKIKRSKKTNNASDTPHYENVPFEVPDNWAWTTLGEICLFLSRGKSPKYSDSDKTYPVFAQKCNLKEGGISLEQARFLDPSTICKWSEEYKLKTGDVLVNSTGTGTVGRTRLFHESYLKHYPFVVPDSHVSVIRTASEIKSEFVFAYISSKLIQEYLEDNLAGSTNQKELYIGVLSDLSFPLPPLAEQQRIVTEIEKWFSLIDQIEQGKDDLHSIVKQTKSKILDLAIHGELVPQDPNDEPAIELLKRINPSFTPCDNGHYPQLPDSWTIVPMQMLCSLTDGEKLDGKGMPNLDVKYLRGERDFKTLTNGRYVAANSLLILVDGENSGEVFRTPIEGYQGSTFKQLHINENMLAEYILHVINLHRKALRENKVGSAIPHLDKKLFKAIEVPVPPYDEQVRIVTVINSMHSKLDAIMENL